jgi:hypothetical protein
MPALDWDANGMPREESQPGSLSEWRVIRKDRSGRLQYSSPEKAAMCDML